MYHNRSVNRINQPVASLSGWFDDAAMSIWGGADTTQDVAIAQTALVKERVKSGAYTPEQGSAFQAEINNTRSNLIPAGSETPSQGFWQGANEGLQAELAFPGKVVGFVGDSVGKLGGGILKGIPWWIYAGGLIVGLVYLAPMITSVLKLKSSR